MKISNFSKTVRKIIIKVCTGILHAKGPLCAQKHQNNRMTRISETLSKLAKKQPFFDFVRFSQKLFTRFELNFLQLLGFSKDWDSNESEGKRPKTTPLSHMRLWFKFSSNRRNLKFFLQFGYFLGDICPQFEKFDFFQ